MLSLLLRKHSNLISVAYRSLHVSGAMDPHINTLKALFIGAVDSVKPKALFESFLRDDSIKDQLHLPNKRYHVVGFGKAVLGMAVQMERILGERLVAGCISIPTGTLERFKNDLQFQLSKRTNIVVREGARNNLPDAKAVETAKKIKCFTASMTDEDILCVLVSGGGSALLPLPKSPITLDEKLNVIKLLAAAGASIEELNVVRILLSDVKGGKLALAAKHSHKLLSFVISDIVGDPIPLIASGPTVGTTVANKEALNILEKYQLSDKMSHLVVQTLNHSDPERVEVPGDIHLIGSNKIALQCIIDEASKTGIVAMPLTSRVQGNIAPLGKAYAELATIIRNFQANSTEKHTFIETVAQLGKSLHYENTKATELVEMISNNVGKDLLLIAGGEPTVVVQGHGLGGRNQELALRFSLECWQKQNQSLHDVVLLSAGTDGIDGPTEAAGAIGGVGVVEQFNAMASQKFISGFIEDNDSNTFFKLVGNGKYHVVTGHTGTNVMDIHMLYIPWRK